MRKLLISITTLGGLIACGPADRDSGADAPDADHGHDHSAGSHSHDAAGTPGGETAAAAVAKPLFDTPLVDLSRWRVFGAGVHTGEAVPVAELLAEPGGFEGRPVRVAGPIAAVCQTAGSWVRLGSQESNMFVRFRDYAFFVPKDVTGDAVVEGFVRVEEVSVELQKHLLEEAGEHEAAAKVTQPKITVDFEAHGVAFSKGG